MEVKRDCVDSLLLEDIGRDRGAIIGLLRWTLDFHGYNFERHLRFCGLLLLIDDEYARASSSAACSTVVDGVAMSGRFFLMIACSLLTNGVLQVDCKHWF